jgi:hypothetical protein
MAVLAFTKTSRTKRPAAVMMPYPFLESMIIRLLFLDKKIIYRFASANPLQGLGKNFFSPLLWIIALVGFMAVSHIDKNERALIFLGP